MGPWEELLNATIKGALPVSTFTEKEAEGGTGVGMGVRVAVVGLGIETFPEDGVGSAGVAPEDAGDSSGALAGTVVGAGTT